MQRDKSKPIASVVIPAHNEGTVITRCLESLLTGFAAGELDVTVVCNGCTDDTAGIVRSGWPEVRLLEIPQASKPAALRAADLGLEVFPVIYLDADVVLPGRSAKVLIETLQPGADVAARPAYHYDTTWSSAFVRSYYRGLERVQSGTNSLWGGVYGLSIEGRRRFGQFPDLIADDTFVDQWFDPAEIVITDEAPAVITVPRSVLDLFRISRRRRRGTAELRSGPGGPPSTAPSTVRSLLAAATTGWGAAMDTLVFLAFAVVVRVSVAMHPPVGWSRDLSSRGGAEPAPEQAALP